MSALVERLNGLVAPGCRHDMGFDRELGPIGCDLELEGKGGCPCAVFVPSIREAASEIERLAGERDRQYDGNVNRMAAEGAALLEVERLREAAIALITAWDTYGRISGATHIGPLRAALEAKP